MLSICIPVYNYDVRPLVNKLIKQLDSLSEKIEILIGDDGSKENIIQINSELECFDQVKIIQAKKNIGRAAIRNLIAGLSKFNYLLFLDCDSDIDNLFINNYLIFINDNTEVICGGTLHPEKCPSLEQKLRWKSGRIREDIKASKRSINPFVNFTSNNFIIKRELFESIKFNERIRKYGHEDTLFGIDLEYNKARILHIDNPAIHLGIDFNDDYINKTQQAIENVFFIMHHSNYNQQLLNRITLLRYYQKLKKLKLNRIIKILFNIAEPIIKKNLFSGNPSLFLFDCFKLGHLAIIDKK